MTARYKKKRYKTKIKKQLKQKKFEEVMQVLDDRLLDTSDIPEVLDWSKSVRGKFYRGPKR